ncbi:uncharacterized protein LOC105933018 [Fundulus heteroclitus]|uniref:uncharacterized protein LOC105933018 n=1 Tax=Fundulus heteroclitus TaxID=8078 RepID=UPI00165C1817|nr:uncharacterized protein LOC105933018 [Fundulus heteroclitus]
MQGLKMSRKLIICVAVSVILTSVYAARRSLNSISDLTNCPLSERTNIIELLHWFANKVYIHDRICLTFDPTSAYGSHHYGNYGNLLDPLPRGYQYYTIGNIYEEDSESLPDYVRNPRRRNINHNKARIIIRVNKGNAAPRAGQTIDQVYITQHYDGSDDYDPDHTYRITPSLLQAVRRRGIDELQQLVSSSQRENPSTHLHGIQHSVHPTSST